MNIEQIEKLLDVVRKGPEEVLRSYTQAKTREEKADMVGWIGGHYKEKGLLTLVDYLYSERIGDARIREILKKYSLFDEVVLEMAECDSIVAVVLSYLETPCPYINDFDEELKYWIDNIVRESAARVLVVLNRYPNTSEEAKTRIRQSADLTVMYLCPDRMSGGFDPIPLSRYLSGYMK